MTIARVFGVARQQVEPVADVDVGHVAERDDVGEADIVLRRPVDQRGGDGARLRQQGDVAGLRRHMREAGIEPEQAGSSGRRVLGPMIRKRFGRAASSMAWRRPFSRVSPAVMTTAARPPISPSSPMMPGTRAGGVAMTPRSGAPGRALDPDNSGGPQPLDGWG